jgi:predicted RNA polymerase sigma factor
MTYAASLAPRSPLTGNVDLGRERTERIGLYQRLRKCPIGESEMDQFALAADWSQVVAPYDQLVRLDTSPIIALNRAVAVAELDGPEVALAGVDCLKDKLAGYHAYHAIRADLLRRRGRSQKLRAASCMRC